MTTTRTGAGRAVAGVVWARWRTARNALQTQSRGALVGYAALAAAFLVYAYQYTVVLSDALRRAAVVETALMQMLAPVFLLMTVYAMSHALQWSTGAEARLLLSLPVTRVGCFAAVLSSSVIDLAPVVAIAAPMLVAPVLAAKPGPGAIVGYACGVGASVLLAALWGIVAALLLSRLAPSPSVAPVVRATSTGAAVGLFAVLLSHRSGWDAGGWFGMSSPVYSMLPTTWASRWFVSASSLRELAFVGVQSVVPAAAGAWVGTRLLGTWEEPDSPHKRVRGSARTRTRPPWFALMTKEWTTLWRDANLLTATAGPLVLVVVSMRALSGDLADRVRLPLSMCAAGIVIGLTLAVTSVGREGLALRTFWTHLASTRQLLIAKALAITSLLAAINLALVAIWRHGSANPLELAAAVLLAWGFASAGVGFGAAWPRFDASKPLKAAGLPAVASLYAYFSVAATTTTMPPALGLEAGWAAAAAVAMALAGTACLSLGARALRRADAP
ncbi:hypothetical protein FJZ36_13050 [Candidatus Poribacteria bacterium]|nr:hypothetical protein [Candidatus Poribacteria bacterium]